MDFALTEEQQMFKKTMDDFVKQEISPGYLTRSKKEKFHWNEHKKLGEMGILGMGISEKFGGDGEPNFINMGIATEAVAYGDINLSYGVLLLGLMGQIIDKHANEEIKQEWLPGMVQGKKLVALALTEPDSGADAAALKTRVVREGNEYVLNGEKTSVTSIAHADAAIVFAKTDPTKKASGVSAFMVPTSTSGVMVGRFHDMGAQPLGRGTLTLDNVRIPARNLIGPEGKGFSLVMNGFDFSRVLIALMVLGSAQASIDETIAYTKIRRTFGQPLAKYEGIQFPIAEYLTEMEAARLLCYKTLWLRQQNLPHTKEAAMVKWWAPKLAVDAIHQALLFHGHSGYSDEYPHEQRYRDVMGLEIGDGTAEIQKIIIARETFGRDYLPY